VNQHIVPTYYPNLVTLSRTPDQTAVLEQISDLIDRNLPGRRAVKASFQKLDLSALGFDTLFEASWLWREFLPQRSVAQTSDIRWMPVTSLDELAIWETAWSKANGIDDQPRKFSPPLLADNNVVIFAGYRGQKLIAGGIANSTEAVVGLSNVFGPPNDEHLIWAGLLANAQTIFPGKHTVGYEHGQSLRAALLCGFEEIGALSVWLLRA
jgi:hypothetical protein